MDDSDTVKSTIEVPSTPPPMDVIPASQETILSTERSGSPMDADGSYGGAPMEDINTAEVIPSSQTPPSDVPQAQQQAQAQTQQQQPQPQQQQRVAPSYANRNYSNINGRGPRRATMPSPPITAMNTAIRERRESTAASGLAGDFVAPTTAQIAGASADELRAMLQASMADSTRLKMETAHHKLQFNLLHMQADEDAKRAAVEHEMTRREVEALRQAENVRAARRELDAATDSWPARYSQLKVAFDELTEENESLQRRVKLAKRIIQQKEEETANLGDEKELLLNRLRENREHFHLLCSPGGMFHGAMTPKTCTSPVQTRAAPFQPFQTPRAKTSTAARGRGEHGATEPIAALLQALSQDGNGGNSAPNTPITGHRPPPRHVARHHRNVQSLSSLPTTPAARSRSGYSGLLPSVDVVPQTEPAARFYHPTNANNNSLFMPETPTRHRHRLPDLQERRPSRESTISAEDGESSSNNSHTNEELARQALESVAARAAAASAASTSASTTTFSARVSHARSQSYSHTSSFHSRQHDVFESQASQAASAMLRRDPRDNFEMTESSRDGTPSGASSFPTEKSVKLQAKLFGGLNKSSNQAGSSALADKRKFSGAPSSASSGHADGGATLSMSNNSIDSVLASPTKKARVVPSLRDASDSHRQHHYHTPVPGQTQPRVGLGIQYN